MDKVDLGSIDPDQPERSTIRELKSFLTANGIEFDPKLKKAEYVYLANEVIKQARKKDAASAKRKAKAASSDSGGHGAGSSGRGSGGVSGGSVSTPPTATKSGRSSEGSPFVNRNVFQSGGASPARRKKATPHRRAAVDDERSDDPEEEIIDVPVFDNRASGGADFDDASLPNAPDASDDEDERDIVRETIGKRSARKRRPSWGYVKKSTLPSRRSIDETSPRRKLEYLGASSDEEPPARMIGNIGASAPGVAEALSGLAIPLLIGIALAVVGALVYMAWPPRPLPFCDSGLNSIITAGGEGELDGAIECRPCPSNGVCEHGLLECPTPLKREGDKCVEDTELVLLAHRMAAALMEFLRDVRGQFDCGYADSPVVTQNEVLEHLRNQRIVDAERFTTVFEQMSSHLSAYNVTTIHNDLSFTYTTLEASLPLTCRTKRILWEFVYAIRYYVAAFVAAVVVWLWLWIRSRRAARARVEEDRVFELVVTYLIDRAKQGLDEGKPAGWSEAQLRDQLEVPASVWKNIKPRVKRDNRIQSYAKQLYGAQHTMWAWIGPIPTEAPSTPFTPTKARNSNSPQSGTPSQQPMYAATPVSGYNSGYYSNVNDSIQSGPVDRRASGGVGGYYGGSPYTPNPFAADGGETPMPTPSARLFASPIPARLRRGNY